MFLFHNDLSLLQCISVSISFPSSNVVLEEKFKIWFCFFMEKALPWGTVIMPKSPFVPLKSDDSVFYLHAT